MKRRPKPPEPSAILKAAPGRYMLVELEPDLHHSRVTGICHNTVLMPGVVSIKDLAFTPLEFLVEHILMQLQDAPE